MPQLEGKIVWITGGASGIGRAAAERAAAEGAHVLVVDRDVENGKALAEQLSGEFVELDVSDGSRWCDTVEAVTVRHGGIDVAFLNAGVSTLPAGQRPPREGEPPRRVLTAYAIEDLPDDAYRRIIGANIDGVVFGARAVVPAIRARGGGHIVATASLAGLVPFAPDPVYTMTKHAVVGLVRALAVGLEPAGIRVHALCPAVVDTAILGPSGAERARELGIPVMPPTQIADALMHVLRAEQTGGLWVCLPGRDEPTRYEFAPATPEWRRPED